MRFEPVWISSIVHMETFHRVFRDSCIFQRILGIYRLPEGFPFTRGMFGIPWRIPLVMYANGQIEIHNKSINFLSQPSKTPFHVRKNLLVDFEFVLNINDILSIKPYIATSPLASYFNLPFVQVLTKKGGELSDFLMCVGGLGPLMGKIKQKNMEFLKNLNETFPKIIKLE